MDSRYLTAVAALFASSLTSVQAADRSFGVVLGGFGPGINYSHALPITLKDDDSLQLRLQLSGVPSENSGDIKEKGNTYTGSIGLADHKVTADWYPSERSQFFLAAGMGYVKTDLDVHNKAGSGYTVGDIVVGNDGSRLDVTVEQSAVAPYLGVGWGNKLAGKDGLSFFAELGLIKPLDDAKVSLTSTSDAVTQADINKEKREIEDAFNDVRLTAALGVSYRF